QGLSLKNIQISVTDRRGREVYSDFGEMMFTHFGVSGPVVLSASSHIRTLDGHRLTIDLKPALSEKQLDARLVRDFQACSNRDFCNALDGLFPKKLIPVMVKLSGILEHTKVHQITKEQRKKLGTLCKNLTVTLTAMRPIEEAIITSGGVSVKEINPSTMESKLVPGLFFCGEMMDVDAYTGGFNLQIAFSTGYLAGQS
ncbi:MAG: aminoacetone oxidase family FAD-binding enzyme, partial [Clostridia bacterium]|nr:aminoacetone oxidase family FAD-binding enzyme [Clostridia bacterium]